MLVITVGAIGVRRRSRANMGPSVVTAASRERHFTSFLLPIIDIKQGLQYDRVSKSPMYAPSVVVIMFNARPGSSPKMRAASATSGPAMGIGMTEVDNMFIIEYWSAARVGLAADVSMKPSQLGSPGMVELFDTIALEEPKTFFY